VASLAIRPPRPAPRQYARHGPESAPAPAGSRARPAVGCGTIIRPRAKEARLASPRDPAIPPASDLDPALRARLESLFDEGHEIWSRFDIEVRQKEWHPFVPADYHRVLETLLELRGPGLRFLEWGSATGVITITADLLGYEACGIEIDPALVAIARDLAARHGSNARFAEGSFLPAGYRWRPADRDARLGSIGEGRSGYLELGHPLEDFDLVFGYPWEGEAPVMHDVMNRYGALDARFLRYGPDDSAHIHPVKRPGG